MSIALIDAGTQPWIYHIIGGIAWVYDDTGADLRVSPAVTRLTVYRRPQVDDIMTTMMMMVTMMIVMMMVMVMGM